MECIHVGIPPSGLFFNPGTIKKKIYFNDFRKLPTDRGIKVESPAFHGFNHAWKLILYPGGTLHSDNGMTALYVQNCSESKIDVNIRVAIRELQGWRGRDSFHDARKVYIAGEARKLNASFVGCVNSEDVAGWANFERFSELDRSLDEGSLVIEVKMKLLRGLCDILPKSNDISQGMMSLFLDEELADVAFKAGDEIFYAHKCIIKAQENELFILCGTFDKDNPMPINDVDPNIFRKMLRSLYGEQISPDEWNRHSKIILEAAGKYGLDSLKLEADARYTEYCELSLDNVIDELLYADANNCPVLKKAAMTFIVENGTNVLATSSFARLQEALDLMKEVLSAAFNAYDESKKWQQRNSTRWSVSDQDESSAVSSLEVE